MYPNPQPKTKAYPNFYENLEEAQARLLRTVVKYDDLPYYVFAITNHKPDKIFRVYLEPLGDSKVCPSLATIHQLSAGHTPNSAQLGAALDGVMDTHFDHGCLRKHINSPLFNRFRPFPLGMCNRDNGVSYLERTPIRPSMLQGLCKQGIVETPITAGVFSSGPKSQLKLMSSELKDCILGDHFSPVEALSNLTHPDGLHDAVAFHREFALVLGPLDIIFLAYRSDIIGILPNRDFSQVRLDRDFTYCKEVVQDLYLFNNVTVN